MEKSSKIMLAIIFLLVLGLRLFIAFDAQGINYSAYDTLRHVENIKETGVPLFNDSLSFGGRSNFFSPLYHYVMAGFSYLLGMLAFKIIPNIFASLTVIVVFFISYHFTNNEKISLVSAFFSGFLPVFFINTINNLSINTAVVPVFFLTVYYFLKTNQNPSYVTKLLITMVLLTLLSPISILLSLSLIVYLLLIKAMGFRESLREPEIVLFFTFFVLWINMVLYKVAISEHGLNIFLQNLPLELISTSFQDLSLLPVLYSIGIVPLIFGFVSTYTNLFYKKKKTVTLMVCISLIVFFALMMNAVQFVTGLMILGVGLTVLAAYSVNNIYESAKNLKLKSAPALFIIGLLIIGTITFIPSISDAKSLASDHPSEQDIEMFYWLKNNTNNESTVLVMPKEGSAMSFYSERKNVIDTNYLTIKNVNTRYDDVFDIYDSFFLTSALEDLTYYSINYVAVSEYAAKNYNFTELRFEDDSCVPLIYEEEVNKVYRVRCEFRT